jgi:TP53 regulating kinase-like protein
MLTRAPWGVLLAAQRVFRVTFLQRAAVAKQRFTKRYRHPDLDAQLTKSRLQGVRACLRRRRQAANTPRRRR